jgi:hypothetical protein
MLTPICTIIASSWSIEADGGHYVGWTLHKKADGKDLKADHRRFFFSGPGDGCDGLLVSGGKCFVIFKQQ